MKTTAKLKNLRVSPRKVRLVTNLIKGMDVNNALVQLVHVVKGSSTPVEKLLKSAIANAENNFGLDKDNLFISDVQVGEGPSMKRWLPRAHGRATQLIKRTSHIYLTLDERVEGKGRKVKAKAKKTEKEVEAKKDEDTAQAKEIKKVSPEQMKSEKKVTAKGQKGGFSKKMFNRKSV
jgi:large subunit ribosomal protein L22